MENCIFCKKGHVYVDENDLAIAFRDAFPVVPGHTLIIPKRHVRSFFDLRIEEKVACIELISAVRDELLRLEPLISGFNVGFNDGKDAGQTVFHSHIHIIPRRKGDVKDSTGGIRNIIR